MQHFTIRRGDTAPRFPDPSGPITDATGVTSVALLGEDWPGLRPQLKVDIGASVRQGQVLFTDRKHPDVCFVSPLAGVVESVTFGPRRTLDTLVIQAEVDDEGGVAPREDTSEDPRKVIVVWRVVARISNAALWLDPRPGRDTGSDCHQCRLRHSIRMRSKWDWR